MLNYTITGDAGPTIVIVHGLYGSGRNWGVIAKRLSDAFRVVTPDLRNHGHSLHSDDHSYEAMARDLEDMITHLGGPVCLCGHSMGGKAAMVLALTRPDLVERLLVADIAPVPYTHSQLEHIVAMHAVDLNAVTRRSDAAQQLAAQGTPPALQSFFTQSLDVPERRWLLNLEALADNMDAIMGFPSVEAQFDKTTLFLSGAESDYVQTAHRPTIKSLFPKARFARIAGAGHWLHADKPREFEATLRAFASS